MAPIAQAPITDLIGADHAKLSDEGDAVRRWIGCTPEENEAVWRQLNPVDHPPNTSVMLFHGEHDEDGDRQCAKCNTVCAQGYRHDAACSTASAR